MYPVLSTDLRPISNSEQVSCSGDDSDKRDIGIHGDVLASEADTTLNSSDVSNTQIARSP